MCLRFRLNLFMFENVKHETFIEKSTLIHLIPALVSARSFARIINRIAQRKTQKHTMHWKTVQSTKATAFTKLVR